MSNWNPELVSKLRRNILVILMDTKRHLSSAGLSQIMMTNNDFRIKKTISRESLGHIISKYILGHNGIIGTKEIGNSYEFWFDNNMELMHNVRDFTEMI